MCNFRALPLEQKYNFSGQSAQWLVLVGYAGAGLCHRSPVTDFLWQGDFLKIDTAIFFYFTKSIQHVLVGIVVCCKFWINTGNIYLFYATTKMIIYLVYATIKIIIITSGNPCYAQVDPSPSPPDPHPFTSQHTQHHYGIVSWYLKDTVLPFWPQVVLDISNTIPKWQKCSCVGPLPKAPQKLPHCTSFPSICPPSTYSCCCYYFTHRWEFPLCAILWPWP